MVTEYPLACNNLARDAEIIPFPREEVTPPVTNTYFTSVNARKFYVKCLNLNQLIVKSGLVNHPDFLFERLNQFFCVFNFVFHLFDHGFCIG